MKGRRKIQNSKFAQITADILGLKKGQTVLLSTTYKTKSGIERLVVRHLKQDSPEMASYYDPRWSVSTSIPPDMVMAHTDSQQSIK